MVKTLPSCAKSSNQSILSAQMEALILDTSTNRPFLLRAADGQPIDLLLLEGGEKLSRELGAEVKKFTRSRPDFIAIGTGPGSFTGIRVGVAIAKALAFGWDIPLVGFPSLLSFAPAEAPFAILADARSGGLYCQREETCELLPIETAPLALAGVPLFSPHASQIAKRAHFPQGVEEALPNGAALSKLSFQRKKSSPLAPFPLAYLDGKA